MTEFSITFSAEYRPSEENRRKLQEMAEELSGMAEGEYDEVPVEDLVRYVLDSRTADLATVGVVVHDSEASVIDPVSAPPGYR